jgi:hypothetical protein
MTASVNILDFQAVPDGETLNTIAIQSAIDAAATAGGGTVLVPAGCYLTGTIFLKSHVTLELAHGATLLGSGRLDDYAPVRWGHHMDRTPWHLVMADGVEDIGIMGRGTISGNGPEFWKHPRKSEWHFWVEEPHRPSPMVEISNCRDIRIADVLLESPAGWTLHLHDSDRAVIRGIRIEAELFGPNTDGIDLTGCHDVAISDCLIKAGDDAIALKTTVDSRDCRNIAVTNCVLETNCCAIRVGHESAQDFRFCTFSNCVIKRSSRAIDILNLGGCMIEYIHFSNIVGSTNCGWPFNRPIQIQCTPIDDLYVSNLPPEHPRHGEHYSPAHPGIIRDIRFSEIDLETDGRVTIGGVRGSVIENITFRSLHMRYPFIDDPSVLAETATSSTFYPSEELAEFRGACAAIVAQNVRDLVIDGLALSFDDGPVRDDWLILRSELRHINEQFYTGNEDALRSREKTVPFGVLWGRDLDGGRLTLQKSPPSWVEEADVDRDSSFEL